jgi:hypothetical protein
MIGNSPQAFTHMGLINAAWAIQPSSAAHRPYLGGRSASCRAQTDGGACPWLRYRHFLRGVLRQLSMSAVHKLPDIVSEPRSLPSAT